MARKDLMKDEFEEEIDGVKRFKIYHKTPDFALQQMQNDSPQRKPISMKEVLEERINGPNTHDRILMRGIEVTTSEILLNPPEGDPIIGLYSSPLVQTLLGRINEENASRSWSKAGLRKYYNAFTGQAEKDSENFYLITSEKKRILESGSRISKHNLTKEILRFVSKENHELVEGNLSFKSIPANMALPTKPGLYLLGIGYFPETFLYANRDLNSSTRMIGELKR